VNTTMATHSSAWWARLARLMRHRWSEGQLHRRFPPALVERLRERVAASERLHTGQIRICIEAGLPWSYLWRGATARERAVTQFGKLRVWDTEHNNGVLIYLLQAEHAIEIVADRGLVRAVTPERWQTLVASMGEAFRSERYEDGLNQALNEVTELLVQYFPVAANAVAAGVDGQRATGSSTGAHPNELPDSPVVGRTGWLG
jgi:uncharacterized membrane protein